MLELSFSILHCSSYIVSIAKTAFKKIGALIHSMIRFFLLRLFFISINLLCSLAWNTFVMYGLVPLTATWKR